MLVDALKRIAANDDTQVLITTHSSIVVKELKFDDIRIITENNGTKQIKFVDTHYLPTPSLNEVNYLTFGEILTEYHDELYGYLQTRAIDEDSKYNSQFKFDDWLKAHGCTEMKTWRKVEKDGSINSCNFTLATYIRNRIHHPENTNNVVETIEEIDKSIIAMQNVVTSLT